MDDAIVDLLDGFGGQKLGLRLGTPDLADASLLVAHEDEDRLAVGGRREAWQGRSSGQSQGAVRERASVQHSLNMDQLHSCRKAASLGCERGFAWSVEVTD
jgi:hypothetical protein